MSFLPVDVIIDQKAKEKHRIDTLNLLAYVVLLVLVLVTTWFFKRKRKVRLYIHETGLAIIYGMIMGAGLRYFGLEIKITSPQLEVTIPLAEPADYVTVEARNLGDKTNQTHLYAYEFRGELQPGTKLGSQISYASVDPEIFFNIILPPIVLNAGLSLKRRHFFRNIGAIFSYAFLGTTISVAFVGAFIYGSINLLKIFFGYQYLADQFSLANCLYFGAIISPTDPLAVLSIFQELGVDVNLFALVFGESILNDAVSIVLTHSIDQFSVIYGRNPYYSILLIIWECFYNFIQMFLTSCLIGCLFGIISAITTKFTKLSETPLLETSLVVLMSYSSFLTAEVIDSSGIVAILLCGITQAHYTINNLSYEAQERLKNLFELLTFLCENFLFLAVGMSFWQRGQNWNLPFIGIAFIAVTIARALSIYPLTVLLNFGRRKKIPLNYQHIIAWGGAARGVISYSLAAKNTVGDARRIMLSTTSVIVIFSVIVVGGTVDLMLRCLRIPYNGSKHQQLISPESIMYDNTPNTRNQRRFNNRCNNNNNTDTVTTTASQQETTITSAQQQQQHPYENASLVRHWRNLDNNFIKPLLTNSYPTLMETLPPSLRGIARIFTSEEQQLMQRQTMQQQTISTINESSSLNNLSCSLATSVDNDGDDVTRRSLSSSGRLGITSPGLASTSASGLGLPLAADSSAAAAEQQTQQQHQHQHQQQEQERAEEPGTASATGASLKLININ